MIINNQPESSTEVSSKFNFLHNKKVLIGIAVAVILFVFTIAFLIPSKNTNIGTSPNPSTSINKEIDSSKIKKTPDLQKAIDEASNSSTEFVNQDNEQSYDYPWLRKFPLATDQYFVYFDTDKRAFVSDLFLTPTDNADQVKSDIQKAIFEITKVPVENFKFEWNIKQK